MHRFYLLIIAATFAACQNEPVDRVVGTDVLNIPATISGEVNSKMPEITFEKSSFDTGKITQGDVLNFVFPFKNTGSAPLIISSVMGSCGCTISRNYPKGKIMPGEGGEIDVEFDSDNKWGEQTIVVNVTTNAIPNQSQLIISTDIVVPDQMKTQ